MPSHTVPARILIVGTGLIGTSVALALRARGVAVWLHDSDPGSAALAEGLGAGTAVAGLREAKGIADVAVLAMPPEAVGEMLRRCQDAEVADVYTDVASVKSLPAARARDLGCDLASYVPGHPLAGRERHGPAAARADLFLGRTWALCPLPETSAGAVAAVSALAEACGAVVVRTDTATHDEWVALVSHAPHVVSSAMAARLAAPGVPDDALRLAGGGLRDVTRIAAGDPALWTQILSANAAPVAGILRAVAADLTAAADSLADMPDLLERGRAGVARIPGKRGDTARSFTVVQVVMADRPGELARLFSVVGDANVNIEDVRIEHSPGHPTGVAELSVRPDRAATLLDALAADGWTARG
jgi:prephenate dehydrogenase